MHIHLINDLAWKSCLNFHFFILHSRNTQCSSLKVHSFKYKKRTALFTKWLKLQKPVIFTAFQLHGYIISVINTTTWRQLCNAWKPEGVGSCHHHRFFGKSCDFTSASGRLSDGARYKLLLIFSAKRTSVHENRYDKSKLKK